MRKIITTLLLVFILLNIAFIILRVSANGSEDNFFNKSFRSKFAQYPIVRYLLALHYDGDAKTDYLGNNYNKIIIEIDSMDGLDVSTQALNLLKEKIEAVTNKSVEFIDSDNIIPYKEKISDSDLKETEVLYRNYYTKNNQAVLYILVVSMNEEQNSTMGSTQHEDGLILYKDELKNFTESNPNTLSNYEESTLLHEFGHQIGLPHNNEPKCLMNSSAEMAHVAQERLKDVVVDFCDYEKEQINLIKTLQQ